MSLWGKTGNVLHRGRLKDIWPPIHANFPVILEIKNKIAEQLAAHLISLNDRKHYVFVMMEDPNTHNVSTVEIMQTSAQENK